MPGGPQKQWWGSWVFIVPDKVTESIITRPNSAGQHTDDEAGRALSVRPHLGPSGLPTPCRLGPVLFQNKGGDPKAAPSLLKAATLSRRR
jgi:hypothetical protein